MTSEQYARQIIEDIIEHKYDTSLIVKTVKGHISSDLEAREQVLQSELNEVRTEILKLSKV